MDTTKEVVIAAKGHTTSILLKKLETDPSFLEDKLLCCINSAYKLFPSTKIDILCFNDIEVTHDDLTKYDIRSVILPYKLRGHDKNNVVRDLNVLHTEVVSRFKPGTTFYTFAFPWQNFNVNPPVLKIGTQYEITSSTQTAICVLCEQGFRLFTVYGVSKDGKYGGLFVEQKDTGNERPLSWYVKNYSLIEAYLKHYKCTYRIEV
jgi:hypothetical protein